MKYRKPLTQCEDSTHFDDFYTNHYYYRAILLELFENITGVQLF